MSILKRISLRISLAALFFMLIAISCDESFNSSIPYARVYFRVNLANYNELTVPGNSLINTKAGYGGVIIFHAFDDTFYAFDAACPYEVDQSVRVEVDVAGTATCPECGSKYNLWLGGIVESGTGPSSEPLKNYQVTVGSNELIITN